MRMLLLAPPGAGKGTQAKIISAHFGIPHISTGDLFRRNVADGTPLGLKVKSYLDSGDLVPDDVVIQLVRAAIEQAMVESGGYLLDGFPRSLDQARLGYRLAKELGATVYAVLHYECSDAEVIRRLLARGAQAGRTDDNEATIRHRLEVYHRETAPLLDYYRGRGLLVNVNAEQPVEEVTAQSLAALDGIWAAVQGYRG
jgi:adenylate kinase